jgi:hypothetical protein
MFPLAIPSTPYNLANVSNITDVAGYVRFANQLSDGIFGWMIVVAMFVLVYIMMSKRDSKQGFTVAAFAGFWVSMFLSLMGIVQGEIVLMMLLMTAVGAAWGMMNK